MEEEAEETDGVSAVINAAISIYEKMRRHHGGLGASNYTVDRTRNEKHFRRVVEKCMALEADMGDWIRAQFTPSGIPFPNSLYSLEAEARWRAACQKGNKIKELQLQYELQFDYLGVRLNSLSIPMDVLTLSPSAPFQDIFRVYIRTLEGLPVPADLFDRAALEIRVCPELLKVYTDISTDPLFRPLLSAVHSMRASR